MIRLIFARKNHRIFFIKNLWLLIVPHIMCVVKILPQMILDARQNLI